MGVLVSHTIPSFSCSILVIFVVKMKRSRPEKGISRGAPPVRKFLTEAAETRYKESVKRNQKLIEERGLHWMNRCHTF